MSVSAAARLPGLLRKASGDWGISLIFMAVAAALMLPGLANNSLWYDEVATAFPARTILTSGLPMGWDGRNLQAYGQAFHLTDNLVDRYPWAPYYLTAASFALFRVSTHSARLPFVLLGILTIPFFYRFTKRQTGSKGAAVTACAVLVLSVPFLLYCRTCRYYALTIFLAVVLLYLWQDLSLRRRGVFALFTVAGAVFMQSHYFMFPAFYAALFVATIFTRERRSKLIAMAVALPIAVAPTLVMMGLTGLLSGGGTMLVPGQASEVQPTLWGHCVASARKVFSYIFHPNFLRLLTLHLREYNVYGLLPVLFLIPLVVLPAFRRDFRRAQGRFLLFVIVLLAAFTVFLCMVSIQDPRTMRVASMRYAVCALPLFAIVVGLTCWELMRVRWFLGAATIVLVLFTDLLTLAPLWPYYDEYRRITSPLPLPFRCYPGDYLYEVTHDWTTPYEAIIAYLTENAHQDDTIVADDYLPLMFYLGDKMKFCAVLRTNDTRLIDRNRGRLPEYVYSPRVIPQYYVRYGMEELRTDVGSWITRNQAQYNTVTLEVRFHDMIRPELPAHGFKPITDYEPWESTFVLELLAWQPPGQD